MKTIFFVAFFFTMAFGVFGQYAQVPDSNFRLKLKTQYPHCFNNNLLDTICAKKQTGKLDLKSAKIRSLEGIQYFSLLDTLICSENFLTQLPTLPVNLSSLDCSQNNLTTLSSLPNNLINLNCSKNKLSKLPFLPSNLEILDCSNNLLSKFSRLPNGLKELYCQDNKIACINPIPGGLVHLKTDLECIEKRPLTLKEDFVVCQTTDGCPMDTNKYYLVKDKIFRYVLLNKYPSCFVNQFLDKSCAAQQRGLLDISSFWGGTYYGERTEYVKDIDGIQFFSSLDSLKCVFQKVSYVSKLPNSIQYINFSQGGIEKIESLPLGLKTFICNSNGLDTLPNFPNGVVTFSCVGNNFKKLSFLNEGLENLNCSYNPLYTLSNLPNSLLYLTCNYNNLSDVSYLPKSLISFDCSYNALTKITSFLGGLRSLVCRDNLLSELPTKLPKTLVSISCESNSLTILPELPQKLESLTCADNLLTTFPKLPVSLKSLNCSGNKIQLLPELPDSLESLDCSRNEIENIRSLPPNLTYLDCSNSLLSRLPILPGSLNHLRCIGDSDFCLPLLPNGLGQLYANVNCLPNLPPNLFWYTYWHYTPYGVFVTPVYVDSEFIPICDSSAICTDIITQKEDGIKKENIKLFPNPASDMLSIENVEYFSFQLLDLYGNVILEGRNKNTMDIHALATGTYFLKLTPSSGNTQVFKFLKE